MRALVHRSRFYRSNVPRFQRSTVPTFHRVERCLGTLELWNHGTVGVRLDTWLDVACLFKTRSEATKACKLNKVIVNSVEAKPGRLVKEDDEIEIHRPYGRKQLITVLGVTDEQLPKAVARTLYED